MASCGMGTGAGAQIHWHVMLCAGRNVRPRREQQATWGTGLWYCPAFVQYRWVLVPSPTKDRRTDRRMGSECSSELGLKDPIPPLLHPDALCTGDKSQQAAGPPPQPCQNEQQLSEEGVAAWIGGSQSGPALGRFVVVVCLFISL